VYLLNRLQLDRRVLRLENDPNANPTLLTLQRYAAALGLTLATTIESA
jgi:DNA-binding phage protein